MSRAFTTLAQFDGTFMMPKQGSTVSASVDSLFYFIFVICAVFFALIVGLMVWFMVVYRRTPQRMDPTSNVTHNTRLELLWSVFPSLLLVLMFVWGFRVFVDMRVPPEDAYVINVNAQQWSWAFTYPNGTETEDLTVPAGVPIKLVMQSADVLHSLYIPNFRVKQDVVPGRYTMVWFEAPEPTPENKPHRLFCTEYCGKDHSNMNRNVIVLPKEDFPEWLENADPLIGMTPEHYQEYVADPQAFITAHPEYVGLMPPAVMGERLYTKKGCVSCHTVDGKANTGPTFQGIWGRTEELADGSSVKVDENYVRESILNPGAKLVKGYGNVMTPYQGRIKDREIDMLIAYLRTLASK